MAKKAKRSVKKTTPPQTPKEFPIRKTKIRVIGIGGGAGNIVSEVALKLEKATFVAANTDLQALKTISRKVIRFPFGQSFTGGLGTGMNAELGEMAAKSEKEKIKKLLSGQDLLIIVACLGGGVSSGATPIFAKISRDLGNLTYGIFTLPFKFEGEKKMELAKSSLEKLKPKLNALSVIPNERIFQIIDRNTPLKSALSAINKILTECLEGLIETIYRPGLINIDFADLRSVLEGQGRLAFLNTAKIQRSEGGEAIKKVLNCPLYPYTMRGAKSVLFNIAGEKKLSLAEVSQISKSIFEMANPGAKIIFGISQPQKREISLGGKVKEYQDGIKVTLLATGCGTKIFSTGAKKGKTKKRTKLEKKEAQLKQEILSKKREEKSKKRKEPKIEQKKVKIKVRPPKEKEESPPEFKIRKNALQIKKEVEEAEKELLKQEEFWEKPAILRKNQNK
jgi:cell division protein FtsZ